MNRNRNFRGVVPFVACAVLAATERTVDLDAEQVDALDLTGDGELTFDDQFALLEVVGNGTE